MSETPSVTLFGIEATSTIPTEPWAKEDVPERIKTFGGTMGLAHLAGPDGEGGVDLWSAEKATGFETGPKPQGEAAFVLEGILRLTPTGGEPTDVNPGQGYYLPIGWEGRFEAIEPVRKVYILL